MNSENYILMMRESLEKKLEILHEIEQKNMDQQQVLLDPNADPDEFEATVDAKASLIEELEKLDAGFENLFKEVEAELNTDKDKYKNEIRLMQELITSVTDVGAHIQSQEKTNYELAQEKFSNVRTQIQKVRSSQKAVDTYYRNMMQTDYDTPQFMDNKK